MRNVILVTGANGQIGSALIPKLQEIYGFDNIIASDLDIQPSVHSLYECLDVMNMQRLQEVINSYNVTQIYHLAAILSAKGEQHPLSTWNINLQTFINVLEVSKKNTINKVFYPSSIAVFGSVADRNHTAQATCLNPSTVYGMSKAAGENWAQYYTLRYKLDVRSLRFPGIISYQSLPGGGTTDYAVEIYHKALLDNKYTCYLEKDTMLPMMYIDDAIRGTIELMESTKEALNYNTAYNIAAVSYSPSEVADSIKKFLPTFNIEYSPDYRQQIASNWPKAINDMEARRDWNWRHEFNLDQITKVMLTNLSHLIKKEAVVS